VLEQADATAQQHRHQMDVKLVDRAQAGWVVG